jgi:hypothetical protein
MVNILKEIFFQLIAVGSPDVEELVGCMTTIYNELKLQLRQAQDCYKEYADVYRKVQPTFKVGDHVWLLRRNIQTTRPSSKLDFQRLGPFPIVKQINNVSFRLALPSSMKIHPVFHVSLLEPYHKSTIPGRTFYHLL